MPARNSEMHEEQRSQATSDVNTTTQETVRDSHRGDVFIAKLESSNLKTVIRILKSISSKKIAHFHAVESGIKFIIQEPGRFQMTAYLAKELFVQYDCRKGEVRFKVSLENVLNSLQMFVGIHGQATTALFTYKGEGHALKIQIEESGFHTDCEIKTINVDELVEVDFRHEDRLCRVICKSDCMRDAFQSILFWPSTAVTIKMSNRAPYFTLETVSDQGTSAATISKDSDYIENFECPNDIRFGYRQLMIKQAQKALAISEKTSIRIDGRGVLLMQFMIRTEEEVTTFIEFGCVPHIDVDEHE
ncbi:hypothetical protein RvY_02562 [Ramazzottius varieornatus]|uniref:Cell cycle checkpoint protein RAD1 n=1 Tax=Ramazzottius varieornatus TaxID=947166 RepID=A0A1D1UUP5_RAMVA|nr:hypothetical protein RvY_02562 [Ramazzottius varieornatus]